MSVIEKAEKRLQEDIRQNDLGADNGHLLAYWAAYLDGARAQKKEGGELAMSALNYVERQGFMTGMDYAGMTAEERETLLKELQNLRVGPVAPLVVEMSDYTRVLKGLRHCINLDGLEPNDTRIRCHGCPYITEPTRCGGILMRDAAAAIEALQAEVKRLNMRCADCEYGNSEWPEDPEHTKMPKRGEWTEIEDYNGDFHYQCSVCGEEWYFIDGTPADNNANYCPRCGAKMEDVK